MIKIIKEITREEIKGFLNNLGFEDNEAVALISLSNNINDVSQFMGDYIIYNDLINVIIEKCESGIFKGVEDGIRDFIYTGYYEIKKVKGLLNGLIN